LGGEIYVYVDIHDDDGNDDEEKSALCWCVNGSVWILKAAAAALFLIASLCVKIN
jgi:hypothetical protein